MIFASSLGTVFEWYDFYLYGTLAVFFSALFFPPGNDTAAFLASLATFGAGFAVRPLGALVFGRIGDLVGRKYTFLITIVVMGLSTALVGVLPTYAQIGIWAPILLVTLRLAQGLALGGEYGGAATYVAEHAPQGKRGYYTSWIQTTATLGFFLSLAVILACRLGFGEEAFKAWGWRVPFLISVVLLAVSVYIRLRLQESPVFVEMKAEGRLSRAPLTESFGAVAQRPHRAARAARRDRRPGRRLVHGPVLRALLPAEHAEARLPDGLPADRRGARDRHAVLRGLRPPVRPHRPQAHHGGRLPARGAHLHPDLQGPHAVGEPGARGVRGARGRDRRGQRLPLPHLREAEDRLRPGARLPDQGGRQLRARRARGRAATS